MKKSLCDERKKFLYTKANKKKKCELKEKNTLMSGGIFHSFNEKLFLNEFEKYFAENVLEIV